MLQTNEKHQHDKLSDVNDDVQQQPCETPEKRNLAASGYEQLQHPTESKVDEHISVKSQKLGAEGES